MKWIVKVEKEEFFKKVVVYGREIEVSNMGTVRYFDLRSRNKDKVWIRRSEELLMNKGRSTYLHINIGQKKAFIHQLVANLFIEKPNDDSQEYVLWFIDRNKRNIKAHNMIWITREECNLRMSLDYAGRTINNDGSERLPFEHIKEIRNKYEEGTPIMHLAKEYKISHTQIKRILSKENYAYI